LAGGRPRSTRTERATALLLAAAAAKAGGRTVRIMFSRESVFRIVGSGAQAR